MQGCEHPISYRLRYSVVGRMAIISKIRRLSRMLPNWVLGVKTPFFPDKKKAACEGSQTAFGVGYLIV